MPKRKFSRPRKKDLNPQEVNKLLSKIGFKAEKSFQEWRHFLAFGNYKGHAAVFKLASTKKVGLLTQNEFNWNSAVHNVPEAQRRHVTVPQNYSSGSWNGLFYFIAERFTKPPIVERDSRNVTVVIKNLNKIAKALFELENLPIDPTSDFATSKRTKKHQKRSVEQSLLESSTEWASQVPKDLSKFLKVIEDSKGLRRCIGHGDTSPRHMFTVGTKIGLIDGEHAGFRGPIYYDVAYFYVRLRDDHFATDAANSFLEEFKRNLALADQKTFWEELKPVLIQRYLGDLWGAAKNPNRLKDLEPFGKEILHDKLV